MERWQSGLTRTPGKCKTVFCFGHQSLILPLWMALFSIFVGAIFAHFWLQKQQTVSDCGIRFCMFESPVLSPTPDELCCRASVRSRDGHVAWTKLWTETADGLGAPPGPTFSEGHPARRKHQGGARCKLQQESTLFEFVLASQLVVLRSEFCCGLK